MRKNNVNLYTYEHRNNKYYMPKQYRTSRAIKSIDLQTKTSVLLPIKKTVNASIGSRGRHTVARPAEESQTTHNHTLWSPRTSITNPKPQCWVVFHKQTIIKVNYTNLHRTTRTQRGNAIEERGREREWVMESGRVRKREIENGRAFSVAFRIVGDSFMCALA